MKKLLSGNEAVALGAFESGVKVASAYPGTPSTEIMENFARYEGVYAEWAPNEKVAMEVVVGSSMAGVRALTSLKHVGLNVAADPLMTLTYIGIKGGLVIACADDPGMHSSQNEQDNRFYARFAQIPMFEPCDSQEARDMMPLAYEVSEKFDTPVLMRLTTRISHSKGVVDTSDSKVSDTSERYGFESDLKKFVMIPAHARARHPKLLEREQALQKISEKSDLNFIEWADRSVGVITSGISYQYVKEVLPDVSILKLGFTYPLPEQKIRDFAKQVTKLFVVEELEPYLEAKLREYGIEVAGKKFFSRIGELSPESVGKGFEKAGVLTEKLPSLRPLSADVQMPRPPLMCAACPHRGLYFALNKLKAIVHGDIGCYTLSVMPPLKSIETCLCMGASISMAHGMAKAKAAAGIDDQRPIFATIGDSTFFHSGINSLTDVVFNQSNVNVVILDNRITAMTGAQVNPGSGVTLQGEPTAAIDLEKLVRSLGVERVRALDPYDIKGTIEILKEEAAIEGPSVMISRGPCVQMTKANLNPVHQVNETDCIGCTLCLRLGCPAISQGDVISNKDGKKPIHYACIDPVLCRGCTMCAQVCKSKAISVKSSYPKE
ncbi:MAG: indolepyruvate ferredoxin oxidoreductase subunit alpha [Desulfobacteraceae bacterium]|nr:indolepyruvate ferredoxin oxidoreductase subunit alpha [Desulfobacteraceae bacterium]